MRESSLINKKFKVEHRLKRNRNEREIISASIMLHLNNNLEDFFLTSCLLLLQIYVNLFDDAENQRRGEN